MKLSKCVACTLPVIELEGQFDKLDSYFLGDGARPERVLALAYELSARV